MKRPSKKKTSTVVAPTYAGPPAISPDQSQSGCPAHLLDRVWTEADRKKELKILTRLAAPRYELGANPEPSEWNFRTCPNDELETCLKYELSREVNLWRQMTHNFRENLGATRREQQQRYYELILPFPFLDIPLYFPEWPSTPWLKLNRVVRKQGKQNRFWPSLRAAPRFRPEDGPPDSNRTRVEAWGGKMILYADLAIDLSQPQSTIQTDFAEWLGHQRRQSGCKPVERRGTRAASDVLKALGAVRLLKVMKWEKAAALLLKNGINSYQDRAAWFKAERLVDQSIDTLKLSLGDVSDVIGPRR